MFEPENDIERALIGAATEPAASEHFLRLLMEAEVLIILYSEDGAIPFGPDGTTIPAGASLSLATTRRDGDLFIPFFTSPLRASTWFSGDHIIAPERTRDLFGRYPQSAFVLNPGSDFGKEFLPGEIERLLAGNFAPERGQTIELEAPTEILLAHPAEPPADLIAALERELLSVNGVRGAWLLLAQIGSAPQQSWILGVDHPGDWSELRTAIDRAVSADNAQGRNLDVVRVTDDPLGTRLRGGIPVLPRKRGFFSTLFG